MPDVHSGVRAFGFLWIFRTNLHFFFFLWLAGWFVELSGQGLVWRMLGDELELRWATGSEEGNKGFIVTRRQGKTQTWVCL